MPRSGRETVRRLLDDALIWLKGTGTITVLPDQIPVERPKRPEHGDFASGVALGLAKQAGVAPRALADRIAARLREAAAGELADVSVAGPGFINLRLHDGFWQRAMGDILAAGPDWGRAPLRERPRTLLEYVSANPTGPLHVGHGRQAAVGDSLARLLRFAGHNLVCEFYLNDAGNQMSLLGQSVWVRYVEAAREAGHAAPVATLPEGGYRGDYVRDLGRALLARDGTRWLAPAPPGDVGPITDFAMDGCLAMIRATLERFGVAFDAWQSERALHGSGALDRTLAELEHAGFVDRRDGAVWLRTTALWGDDKDRVVVKSDGQATYLLGDIAYHREKIDRGFDQLCDVWGADHHGHIPRMHAALKALGHDPARLSVLLVQMVSLLRDGKPVAMGKREGEFVTLDEVMSEVGRDATRFFYLMRRHDTPLDFDLDLAKRQSMDNPVYYAQYAHARCASILQRAADMGAPLARYSEELARRLALPEEIGIVRRLADFPEFVTEAAAAREPHRLTAYVQALAGEFQSYYTRLAKVHGDPILPPARQRVGDWKAGWDWDKTAARLLWVQAIRQVIETALGLMGVSAPQAMERLPGDEAAAG